MDLTLPMETAEQRAFFRSRYFHLYNRLRRLADNLAGLYLCGDPHTIFPENFSDESVPKFCAATFCAAAARRFERYAERMVRSRDPFLPKPDFPVTLDVQFRDGARGRFSVSFLPDPDEKKRSSWLALSLLARKILTKHLDILAIDYVENM